MCDDESRCQVLSFSLRWLFLELSNLPFVPLPSPAPHSRNLGTPGVLGVPTMCFTRACPSHLGPCSSPACTRHLPCCQHPLGLAAAPRGLVPTGSQPPTSACVTLILGPVLQCLLVKKVTADNTGVSGILHSMRDFIVGVSSLSFRLWLIYWLRLHFMWRTIFCLYITNSMELFAFI